MAYDTREAITPDKKAIPPKNRGQAVPPRQERLQKLRTSPKKLSLKGKPEAMNQIKRYTTLKTPKKLHLYHLRLDMCMYTEVLIPNREAALIPCPRAIKLQPVTLRSELVETMTPI